jgi:L-alanine-DL-glutamate epimerase-like enolase superfamily enzyme
MYSALLVAAMTITSLETFILHVPVTRDGIADSTHSITHWGMPGVMIHTDAGQVGYGFTGTHAHLASDRLITSCIEQCYGELLVGENPLEIERLWSMLAYNPPLQWVGRAGIMTMALAAVDIALWDLKAKAAGEPLWKTLGGSEDAEVEVYNTNGGWLNFELQMLIDDAKRLVEEEGYRSIKMKLGKEDFTEDLRRVEAVRAVVGPGVKLMTDVNGRWRMPLAAEVAGRLEDYNVEWIEEPLWHDDVRGHAELAAAIKTPVALGEMLYSLAQFQEFIIAGAVHFVQPDATRLGGISEAWQVSDAAHAAGLPVTPHAGDMAQVQAHLSLAHPGISLLEFIPWIKDCFIEPLRIETGSLRSPEQPGAGTTLRTSALERFSKPGA